MLAALGSPIQGTASLMIHLPQSLHATQRMMLYVLCIPIDRPGACAVRASRGTQYLCCARQERNQVQVGSSIPRADSLVILCWNQCVAQSAWCCTCCAVLCCAVLCCAVLCCAVLCCAVLCCAVLCCAVLCCAVLCAHNANNITSKVSCSHCSW